VNRRDDQADQKLQLLVGLVVSLGAAAVLLAGPTVMNGLTGGAHPPWPVLVTLVALVAAADRLTVEVRIRSTVHGIAWSDAVILVGIAVLPVPWIVMVTALGTILARALRRAPAMKFAFAVGKESITAGLGGLVVYLLGQTGSMTDPVSLPALGLAFLVMTLVDPLLTVPVIALSSRTPVLERFRMNWDVRVVTNSARFLVVALTVLALQLRPELIYAIPLAVLLAHLWHERWVRAREERQAWQHLAVATEAFTGVDLEVVLREAVIRGARLFSADQLEIEVWLSGTRRLVRGSDQIVYDGDPAGAPPEHSNVYAVALHGYPGRRDIGVLRLRFRQQVKMTEREEAMVASYAAALDTAVRNAAAYQQLGEATEAHAYAAAHDALTGLANRRELERELTEALANPAALPARIAVMLIDLRHFKEVNDALGHLSGDRVLMQVAERLRQAAGPNDLVSRFGGDEFAVLLRSAWRPARVEARARRVLRALAEPVTVDGLPIMVEASGGLALAIDPQDEPAPSGTESKTRPDWQADPHSWSTELLRRADVAMYRAKRTGQPLVRYTAAHDPADRDRLALAGQLPRAISEQEFTLHFQPIVDLATGQVVGAEALARWRHPTRGQLDPRYFLDLLERSTHLAAFTQAVLNEALAAAAMWRAAGHDLRVSVNISARSLLDTQLPERVLAALEEHDTAPDRLCLELTETLALSQIDTVDQVLTRLHDLGVRLALDDFGTGFSSLAVLSRIPVHQLKIDRSFVQALRDEPATGHTDRPALDPAAVGQARAVVRSTVQLGRTLDLGVVAEGVESPGQRRLLWELGCAAGQGHLFGRPTPADRLLASLTRGVSGRAGALAEPLPGPEAGSGSVVRLPRSRTSEERSVG
jgi:diguanylate cyclase (GGDEF)-like protein